MATDHHKKEGDINQDKNADQLKKDLETERPISERDEVKKAESRTQDLQKKTSKPNGKKDN